MTLLLVLLAAGGFGVGLWLLLVAVVPSRPSLAASLALLRGGAAGAGSAPAGPWPEQHARGWRVEIGQTAAQAALALGVQFRGLRNDLAVMGRPLEAHLAAKVIAAVVAALAAPALVGLLSVGGVQVPWVLPVWLALALALVGFMLPDQRLRRAATARRAAIRYAVGALLNLVAINLAGGAEVEQALHNALRVSHGWAFTLIRNTVQRAQVNREKAWAALGRLGEQFDVDDLAQLAQHMALAGDEGARMREALIQMAVSIGQRELAEAETHANEASEYMALPLTVLAIGFTLFLLYPALMQLTVGF